jgi:hypothetical protein
LPDLDTTAAASAGSPAATVSLKTWTDDSVTSGQSVEGNICFQVASNDASSLRLQTARTGHDGAFNTWFALNP